LRTTIAILAGGQSRRMGTDKAALEIGGRTLLERAARIALTADLPVVVIGRERPDGWLLPAVTFLPDTAPGRGPLGGLHTALCHANGPVLALACDLPLLTADALFWLLAQVLAQSGLHGLAVLHDGQWEPLFSVYDSACLPLIESRLAAGRLSLHGLLEAGDFGRVKAPDWVAAQLANVNTPEEWARVAGY
jgi:molybdopterin-guanine dinucleotide biosynthesis protein A